jgi:hypothetical protein
MKKVLLFSLLMISYGIHAQSSWTIADGDPTVLYNRTPYLPVWGEEMDNNQHNQLLYFGNAITPLLGSKITKLVFYSTTANESWGGATGIVKLKHTTASSVPMGGIDPSSAEEVYTGAVAVENYTLTFTFATPFT